MRFNLTFCTSSSKLSKHLELLSFQIIHQIRAEAIIHLLLFLACDPIPSQLLSASETLPGKDQNMALRFKKILHN